MSNAGNSGVSGARMAVVFQRSRWKDALCQPSKTVPSSRGIQQLAFVAVALLCLDLRLAGQVSASEVPVEAGLLRAIRWAEGGVQPSITLLNGKLLDRQVEHFSGTCSLRRRLRTQPFDTFKVSDAADGDIIVRVIQCSFIVVPLYLWTRSGRIEHA